MGEHLARLIDLKTTYVAEKHSTEYVVHLLPFGWFYKGNFNSTFSLVPCLW